MNTKDLYNTSFVKLMNFLKFKPLRLLSLLVIAPVILVVSLIVRAASELPELLNDTKTLANDVAHWDELKDTREFGLGEK